MKIKLLNSKPGKYLLVFSSLILLSAAPFFAAFGLDDPEPLNAYLNNNFPAVQPQGLPYEPVFPNLSFDSPLTFNEVPNANKIMVGQRDGQVFWFNKIATESTKNVVIDLSDRAGVVWDGGFLGLALHPKFGTAGNNYMYTWYSTKDRNGADYPNFYTTQNCDNEEYWGNFLVLARYNLNPNTLVAQKSSEQIMLKLRMYGTTHRGGGLLFGDDGFLYLTTGDQTAFKKAQDIVNNLDGGVLRIDVDRDNTKSHPPIKTMPDDTGFPDEVTGVGYWVPNDNPFLSPAGGNFEEYYSIGHRNPHRMTKDRVTGDLYVGEIGGSIHEEINVIKKGRNYGWPLYEGLSVNSSCVQDLYNGMDHEAPLTSFLRRDANAIIGGYVYRGTEVPELQGKYICADYGTGEEIWTIDTETGDYTQLGSFTSTNIISFGEDEQGELYIMKQGSSPLYKMASKDSPNTAMPNLLSETGAFKNLSTLEPADGLVPYDLVESFWSDGALKKRWIGIPNNGTHNTPGEQIAYSENEVWNFPIGSVLIKHFELSLDERNPLITKRLETRFSIKGADGNFYFATYKWDDNGNDAELLTSGLDETINIRNADGSAGTQVWTYPSSSACISCHNPSTGGTLGTRTRYLNKEYTYPKTGRTANQLVTLSHLGILDETISDADTAGLLTSKAMDDPDASLDEKARSYLDLNCAHCHRPGTGNRGNFDLRLRLDLVQTGLLTASPYESLGIPNEKIVDPGKPETSILYHRANSVDPAIMMPPLAKNKVDERAVQMLNDWISQLTPYDNPCENRIIMETYDNIESYSIADLKNEPNFPENPTRINQLDEFRIPSNVADNYGARVKGILKAPETGTYYFWIAGDDHVELNFSTNESETNKTRIAYHEGYTQPLEWNKSETQQSAAINLVAGQNYYIEALMNEKAQGDNLAVGWRRPSDGIGTAPSEVIPCSVFNDFDGNSTIVDVTGVSLNNRSLTIETGSYSTLTASVAPTNASNKSVTWASSNTAIATINSNGRVNAVQEGSARITVTTTDGDFTAIATINVVAPLADDICDNRIIIETFNNIAGGSIAVFKNSPNYPNAPNTVGELEEFRIPRDAGDEYGVRVKGLLKAPETGTYYFWIAGDDGVELSISTDESDGNTSRIAYHNGWTSQDEWNKYATQKSAGVRLVQGQNYYIQGLMSENLAGDNMSVGWRRPSDGNGSEPVEVIPCAMFDNFEGVSSTIVNVTGVSLNNRSLTIEAGANGSLTALVAPTDASDKSVIWASSNTAIATVNANGRVNAVREGTVRITVTTTDGDFTAVASITVVARPTDDTCDNRIIIETYTNIDGGSIAGLKNSPNYPDAPSEVGELQEFSIPRNAGDKYGVRVKGLLKAPETGTYYFWIAGDDGVELSISTNETDGNISRIAYHNGWTSHDEWNKYPTQKSAEVRLVQGQNYYIEGLMSENLAGDNMSVAWRRPSDGNGSEPSEIIPCDMFDDFDGFSSTNVSVTGVTVDNESLTLEVGKRSTLVASVTPANASIKDVTWASNNAAIATVDASGRVTGVKEGNVTITMTTIDGNFIARFRITVIERPTDDACGNRIIIETYTDIEGGSISSLKNSPNYPNAPSKVGELEEFSIPRNAGDKYGVRVKGLLKAPETGTYYFWIAGDDGVELSISANESDGDISRIAYHNGWTSYDEWNKYPTQKSVGIRLVQGQNYYIQGLMSENLAGDNMSVAWRRPSDGNGGEPAEVIPCDVFDNFVDSSSVAKSAFETNLTKDPYFNISPNPASAVLNIAVSNVKEGTEINYAIHSISGSVLLRLKGGLRETVDISDFTSGTYIVVVRFDDSILRKKLIVR